MMDAEQIKSEIVRALHRADLAQFIVNDATQVLDLAGELFVELVVSDAGQEAKVESVVRPILESIAPQEFSFIVRSKWSVWDIGTPTPAYGADGGIRAAVLVPVTLKSGNESIVVTVSVTKLAEWELDRILGRKTDLDEVAHVVIQNALRRGGQSYWNPKTESYLEIASGAAPTISRLLKRTA